MLRTTRHEPATQDGQGCRKQLAAMLQNVLSKFGITESASLLGAFGRRLQAIVTCSPTGVGTKFAEPAVRHPTLGKTDQFGPFVSAMYKNLWRQRVNMG